MAAEIPSSRQRFPLEGQLTTFIPYEGPCYRCLYPTPPPPELAPGCSVAGVLGVVPGILGLLQANEALKVLLGIGQTLAGRLLLFDALETEFTELKLRRDPDCPVCSTEASRHGRPAPLRPPTSARMSRPATTTGLAARFRPMRARHGLSSRPAARQRGRRQVARARGDSIRGVVDSLVAKNPSLV